MAPLPGGPEYRESAFIVAFGGLRLLCPPPATLAPAGRLKLQSSNGPDISKEGMFREKSMQS